MVKSDSGDSILAITVPSLGAVTMLTIYYQEFSIQMVTGDGYIYLSTKYSIAQIDCILR